MNLLVGDIETRTRIKQNLNYQRISKGMRLRDVYDGLCHTCGFEKYAYQTVCHWFNTKNAGYLPKAETLRELCAVFNCDMTDIYEGLAETNKDAKIITYQELSIIHGDPVYGYIGNEKNGCWYIVNAEKSELLSLNKTISFSTAISAGIVFQNAKELPCTVSLEDAQKANAVHVIIKTSDDRVQGIYTGWYSYNKDDKCFHHNTKPGVAFSCELYGMLYVGTETKNQKTAR